MTVRIAPKLIDIRKLPRKAAIDRIVSFSQRFGEFHTDFACHAALPVVLSPDLLNSLRKTFLPKVPETVVADLVHSSLCREVGYELYEMDNTIRNIFLKDLVEDERFGEKRVKELAKFLLAYFELSLSSDNEDERDLATAQQLTALAYWQPLEAARKIE